MLSLPLPSQSLSSDATPGDPDTHTALNAPPTTITMGPFPQPPFSLCCLLSSPPSPSCFLSPSPANACPAVLSATLLILSLILAVLLAVMLSFPLPNQSSSSGTTTPGDPMNQGVWSVLTPKRSQALIARESNVAVREVKFPLEPISATNRVRRRHLSPAFLSSQSYPLLSGKLRMYLGISACHRRLRFLLQPRHRPSCSGLMGR